MKIGSLIRFTKPELIGKPKEFNEYGLVVDIHEDNIQPELVEVLWSSGECERAWSDEIEMLCEKVNRIK